MFTFINESICRYNINKMIEESQLIDIETIIINVVVHYVKNNSLNQGPLGLLNSFGNLEINVVNEGHENRFFNSDVEFFDFFYDDKFNNIEAELKHIGKKHIFEICLYLSIELRI